MKIGRKMWPLERSQGFSIIWPSDLFFYPMWPNFKLIQDFIQSSWPSFMKIGLKIWPLECSQGFPIIWPSDLVFDPMWPNFDLIRDFIQTIILTRFHEDSAKTVTSWVFTSQMLTTHDGRKTMTKVHLSKLRWAKKKSYLSNMIVKHNFCHWYWPLYLNTIMFVLFQMTDSQNWLGFTFDCQSSETPSSSERFSFCYRSVPFSPYWFWWP